MPVSAAERRFIMDQLGKRAQADMIDLWDRAQAMADIDFFKYVVDSFPDIVIPYSELAAEFAATVFEEDFSDLQFTAKQADPPLVAALTKSAEWALGADGRKALDRLTATAQRHIYDGDRNTTIANAETLGMRWIRVARPDACAFCRLLASRTALSDDLYRSKESALGVVGRSSPRGKRLRGARKYGDKYHDDCRCTAKAIPAGLDPMEVLFNDEPEYAFLAEQWNNEYIKARQAAGSGDPKAILSAWRQLGDTIA